MHDQPAVGHLRIKQTLNIICQLYYWSGMRGEVKQYLYNCHVCKQAKFAQDTYNSFFQLLLVPEKFWVDVTMDFVVDLSKNQGYNAILMVVD